VQSDIFPGGLSSQFAPLWHFRLSSWQVKSQKSTQPNPSLPHKGTKRGTTAPEIKILNMPLLIQKIFLIWCVRLRSSMCPYMRNLFFVVSVNPVSAHPSIRVSVPSGLWVLYQRNAGKMSSS